MSEELAWCAGFFDGEGCTAYSGQLPYQYLCVYLPQKDPEVLYRFQAAVGLGHIYGPYSKGSRYSFRASNQQAHKVLDLIWLWLGSRKREQAVSKGYVPKDIS